jgi:hypothetical protein
LTNESSTETVVDKPQFERKKYTPFNKFVPRNRDPDSSFSNDSALSRTSTASTIPAGDIFDNSLSRRLSAHKTANDSPSTERSHPEVAPLSTDPYPEDTLRKLAESRTLLELLNKASVNQSVRHSRWLLLLV